MMIVISILALSLLIFVHELGHFLLAKYFSVQVLEFAIGFGPKLVSKQIGDTVYAIRAIPLGGFVRMAGDNPYEIEASELAKSTQETKDSNQEQEAVAEITYPQMTTDRTKWFLTQSYWPKFWIVLAGPLFNLIFAVILAAGVYAFYGKPQFLELPKLGGVIPGLPAESAKLQKDDLILAINGEPIDSWDELSSTVRASDGKVLNFEIQREGLEEPIEVKVTPTEEDSEIDLVLGDGKKNYKIGIFPASERIFISPTESIVLGFQQVIFISDITLKGLYGMITGKVSAKNISGPLFIFKQGGEAAKTGLDRLIDFMVFLSVSLAILNLLPIPILDGGHLVFFTLEAIRGAPLGIKLQERFAQVGFVFLMGLMLFALSNDIKRIFEL